MKKRLVVRKFFVKKACLLSLFLLLFPIFSGCGKTELPPNSWTGSVVQVQHESNSILVKLDPDTPGYPNGASAWLPVADAAIYRIGMKIAFVPVGAPMESSPMQFSGIQDVIILK